MQKRIFTLILVVALFFPVIAHGEKEKRSSIHELDAYVYLSEEKTISEIRSQAFAQAKRQALEAARTHIKSMTKVENSTVQYDLVKSGAEGAVKILEQKDLGIEDGSRYHVWIKAEVQYLLHPETKKEKEALPQEHSPLTVDIWTDKSRYSRGEEIQVHLRGNRDWYGVVINKNKNGDLIQLLPNAYRRDNYFKGGKTYVIPSKKDQFTLKVSPPLGKEKIIVYASDHPLGQVELQDIGSGLGKFRGNLEDLGHKLRSIRPKAASNNSVQGQFYESSCTLRTTP